MFNLSWPKNMKRSRCVYEHGSVLLYIPKEGRNVNSSVYPNTLRHMLGFGTGRGCSVGGFIWFVSWNVWFGFKEWEWTDPGSPDTLCKLSYKTWMEEWGTWQSAVLKSTSLSSCHWFILMFWIYIFVCLETWQFTGKCLTQQLILSWHLQLSTMTAQNPQAKEKVSCCKLHRKAGRITSMQCYSSSIKHSTECVGQLHLQELNLLSVDIWSSSHTWNQHRAM